MFAKINMALTGKVKVTVLNMIDRVMRFVMNPMALTVP